MSPIFQGHNLKAPSPRQPSWIDPTHAPLFLPLLNSPVLAYTECLGSFPDCFMDNSNIGFYLLSAYYAPGAVLKAKISVNPHKATREAGKVKFREAVPELGWDGWVRSDPRAQLPLYLTLSYFFCIPSTRNF